MVAVELEKIPSIWIDEREVAFFRLTADVFSPAFVAGASALLASYDPPYDEPLPR